MVLGFDVQLTEGESDTTIVEARGELDLLSAATLANAISDACGSLPARLLVDLSQVSYCDSTGLRVMVQASQSCTSKGISFAVVGVPPTVRTIFEITGLENLLAD